MNTRKYYSARSKSSKNCVKCGLFRWILRFFKLSLYHEDMKSLRCCEDLHTRWYTVEVQSHGSSWLLRRSYDNFRLFDQQLHRCIYDRKVSRLPDLPDREDDNESGLCGSSEEETTQTYYSFPRVDNSTHYHYDHVKLPPLQLSLYHGEMKSLRCCEDLHIRWYTVEVQSHGSSWLLRRSYENFLLFDQQLHRCIYDREVSRLPDLPEKEVDDEDCVRELLERYLSLFSQLAGSHVNCGPVLSWFELDNCGGRLHVPDMNDPSINTPPFAAAYSVRRYSAQAGDEILLDSGLCGLCDEETTRGGSVRNQHLTGSASHESTYYRFPRLDQCAHYHYDQVELPPLQLELGYEDLKSLRWYKDLNTRCYTVYVKSHGSSWMLRRSYANYRFLDQQLHRCIYDRKVSRLPVLPEKEDDDEDCMRELLERYLSLFSELAAGSHVNCGLVLGWLELNNRGRRFVVPNTDDCPINTPADAVDYTIRRFSAQASDEISFDAGDMTSVIDMQLSEEAKWWRGKRGFPGSCVAVIGDKVPCSLVHPGAVRQATGNAGPSQLQEMDNEEADSSLDPSEIQMNFDLEESEMQIFSEDETLVSCSVRSGSLVSTNSPRVRPRHQLLSIKRLPLRDAAVPRARPEESNCPSLEASPKKQKTCPSLSPTDSTLSKRSRLEEQLASSAGELRFIDSQSPDNTVVIRAEVHPLSTYSFSDTESYDPLSATPDTPPVLLYTPLVDRDSNYSTSPSPSNLLSTPSTPSKRLSAVSPDFLRTQSNMSQSSSLDIPYNRLSAPNLTPSPNSSENVTPTMMSSIRESATFGSDLSENAFRYENVPERVSQYENVSPLMTAIDSSLTNISPSGFSLLLGNTSTVESPLRETSQYENVSPLRNVSPLTTAIPLVTESPLADISPISSSSPLVSTSPSTVESRLRDASLYQNVAVSPVKESLITIRYGNVRSPKRLEGKEEGEERGSGVYQYLPGAEKTEENFYEDVEVSSIASLFALDPAPTSRHKSPPGVVYQQVKYLRRSVHEINQLIDTGDADPVSPAVDPQLESPVQNNTCDRLSPEIVYPEYSNFVVGDVIQIDDFPCAVEHENHVEPNESAISFDDDRAVVDDIPHVEESLLDRQNDESDDVSNAGDCMSFTSDASETASEEPRSIVEHSVVVSDNRKQSDSLDDFLGSNRADPNKQKFESEIGGDILRERKMRQELEEIRTSNASVKKQVSIRELLSKLEASPTKDLDVCKELGDKDKDFGAVTPKLNRRYGDAGSLPPCLRARAAYSACKLANATALSVSLDEDQFQSANNEKQITRVLTSPDIVKDGAENDDCRQDSGVLKPLNSTDFNDAQRRARIEKYKEERRMSLREKYRSESFKGESDAIVERLKMKVVKTVSSPDEPMDLVEDLNERVRCNSFKGMVAISRFEESSKTVDEIVEAYKSPERSEKPDNGDKSRFKYPEVRKLETVILGSAKNEDTVFRNRRMSKSPDKKVALEGPITCVTIKERQSSNRMNVTMRFRSPKPKEVEAQRISDRKYSSPKEMAPSLKSPTRGRLGSDPESLKRAVEPAKRPTSFETSSTDRYWRNRPADASPTSLVRTQTWKSRTEANQKSEKTETNRNKDVPKKPVVELRPGADKTWKGDARRPASIDTSGTSKSPETEIGRRKSSGSPSYCIRDMAAMFENRDGGANTTRPQAANKQYMSSV